jgi:hypothetical protein
MAQAVTPGAAPTAEQSAAAGTGGEYGRSATVTLEAGVPGKTAMPGQTHAEQQRREIIRVLSRGKSLATLIADTNQFDLRQACRVTKIALEEDPDFDKKLVELVKSGAASTPDQVVRVLTVLESVCAPPRLLGHILHLKHLEGRVRSKLTLMVGRLTRDPQWLRQQLEDENPRIRANAIEGLWDVRAEGLEELLRSALHDPHHRVAANAALALHKIGDVSAAATMYSMLRHEDEMFRRAALWAIGQARDPRFLEMVEKVAAKAGGDELSLAERVKQELRTSRGSSEFTATLSLEVATDKISESGERRVRLCCVADSVGGWLGQADLNALNFVITEGERQIEEYHLQWVQDAEPFVALLVQPRSWNGNGELLKPALRGAGVSEVYGFLPYQTPYSPVRGKEHDDASEVKFENYLEMSKEYLGRTYEVARSLGAAISLGLSAIQKQKGRRHLFVLADPSVGDLGALEEIFPADYDGTQVHVVVWEHAKQELRDSLQQLTEKSGGRFALASSARDFTRMLVSVRAAQFGSFELAWQPRAKGAMDSARISCYSAYGNGEVVLRSLAERKPKRKSK